MMLAKAFIETDFGVAFLPRFIQRGLRELKKMEKIPCHVLLGTHHVEKAACVLNICLSVVLHGRKLSK